MLFRLILVAVASFMLFRFLSALGRRGKRPEPPRQGRQPPVQRSFEFEESEVTDVAYAESEHKGNGN